MKNWVKQQLTELSAWAGLLMVIGAFLFPRTVFLVLGVLLIATDDEKATAFFKAIGAKISTKIDNA